MLRVVAASSAVKRGCGSCNLSLSCCAQSQHPAFLNHKVDPAVSLRYMQDDRGLRSRSIHGNAKVDPAVSLRYMQDDRSLRSRSIQSNAKVDPAIALRYMQDDRGIDPCNRAALHASPRTTPYAATSTCGWPYTLWLRFLSNSIASAGSCCSNVCTMV
jgi:hypothetical protein